MEHLLEESRRYPLPSGDGLGMNWSRALLHGKIHCGHNSIGRSKRYPHIALFRSELGKGNLYAWSISAVKALAPVTLLFQLASRTATTQPINAWLKTHGSPLRVSSTSWQDIRLTIMFLMRRGLILRMPDRSGILAFASTTAETDFETACTRCIEKIFVVRNFFQISSLTSN